MKFKRWFLKEDGLGTSMAYGGASIDAQVGNNSNMPSGIRSKWVAKDSNEKDQEIGVKPDVIFGFQTPSSKKQTIERPSKTIDKNRKAVPIRDDQSGSIH